VADITNYEVVSALPDTIKHIHGTVDGLINNAGIIQPFVKVNDLDIEDFKRVIDVNFYGAVYMTKAFLPHLLERPEGHIVNISSMGGFLPVPGQTLYGASKAAIKLFSEGLNSELLGTNVGVTVVFPGAIGTDIAANSGVLDSLSLDIENQSRSVTPADEAADTILNAIEKNSYRILIGSDSKMMDLLYRLNPKGAANIIHHQMKDLLPS
jgi:short-subunit dehydrogenase